MKCMRKPNYGNITLTKRQYLHCFYVGLPRRHEEKGNLMLLSSNGVIPKSILSPVTPEREREEEEEEEEERKKEANGVGSYVDSK